jgi:uracil-DNA glycosylase family 4
MYTSTDLLKVFSTIYTGQASDLLEEHFPFFPLTSYGMPLPGQGFIASAVNLGDTPPKTCRLGTTVSLSDCGPNLHYLYRRALYDSKMTVPVVHKGITRNVQIITGHRADVDPSKFIAGPTDCRIMIIGKCPNEEEFRQGRNFVGSAGVILLNALSEAGVSNSELHTWYLTNVCKWGLLEGSSTLPKAHIKECAVLLEQEIRLVRPDYILCLGSDASKHLLGSEFGVQAMAGRVEQRQFHLSRTSEPGETFTCKIMAVQHPANIVRTPELYDNFAKQISSFVKLTKGGSLGGYEKGIKHVNIYTAEHLQQVIDEIKSDPDPWRRLIAVDCEWHGERPEDPGAYLRTVQFSTRHKEAYTVVLRHAGGADAFVPTADAAREKLRQLLLTDDATNWRPRIGGHMLRADLPWLIHFGVDCRAEYAPAARPELCRNEGGWDTSLMYHAVNESTSYRLTDMVLRLTQAPRYDIMLDDWKEDFCREHKLKAKDLEGYGMCPSWVMYPEPWERNHNYAAYDADVTRRIAMLHFAEIGDNSLDTDVFGESSWEPYWIAHRASLGFLEMELNGIAIDRKRLDDLTGTFSWGYQELLEDFRQKISWQDFNPNSSAHCIAFLFGDTYARKLNKDTQSFQVIKPSEALSLNLTPIKATGKPPMLWEDVVANNKTKLVSPSTDKEVLGILGHKHPLAMQLRDLKFIGQVLKFTLRSPNTDEGGVASTDEDGFFEYDGGLPSYINEDNRIRTHLSQLKETGRASSYRPNLQNQTKRREDDYRRIFGFYKTDAEGRQVHVGDYKNLFKTPLYKYPLRSVFSAAPGTVLVEADFKGAELAMLAWMAGDSVMADHVARNNLPSSHPDFYDIHSRMAVSAFHLDCEPTKKGLEKIGRPGTRVAAKNVVFGVPYGRQAAAIQRQCKEEGVDITLPDAQKLIEMYFKLYPAVETFLKECRSRSQDEQWLAGCFGRRRRFTKTFDRKIIGEQERQAQNFTIQNGVADAMNCAIYNFVTFRQQNPQYKFKLLLQIHDALLFEVPITELRPFLIGVDNTEAILKKCMSTDVPVLPRKLDGSPMDVTEPYRFGFDAEIYINWGVAPTDDELVAVGIDAEMLKELAH